MLHHARLKLNGYSCTLVNMYVQDKVEGTKYVQVTYS